MTERLWAPWRLQYIEHADEAEGCIFCDKPAEQDDEKNLLLHRGTHAFVMLNAYPYSNGHLMVAPYRHTARMSDLSPEEMLEMFELLRDSTKWLEKGFQAQGFNIGVNLGKVAGAGIEAHIHVHVVPRWSGDTNFMPVIGDLRVLPQSLEDSYKRLKGAMDE